jgi:D-alanyl-D-alanine carboxypeptidase/D-alanyl-D-alanine-endopeptidase (penicillin-binding protein 4)
VIVAAWIVAGAAAAAAAAPAPKAEVAWRARVERAVRAFGSGDLRHAIVGVEVRRVATGAVLYRKNADISLTPASTLKLVTTAAALDAYGPDVRFATTVQARTPPSADGFVAGDLYLVGNGDPSLSRELGAHPERGVFDLLAESLREKGVRRVSGRVIGSDAAFAGERRGHDWSWEDLVWWYGAEAAGLTFADGAADLKISAGAAAGEPVRVARHPASDYYRVESQAVTCAPGVEPSFTLDRPLGQNVIKLSGCLAPSTPTLDRFVALEDPVLYAATVFTEALRAQGIEVAGPPAALAAPPPAGLAVLTSYSGAPLAEILKDVNKPSHNLRAEMLLRLVGLKVKGEGSADAGVAALGEFLKAHDVDTSGWDLVDGCGQARADLVTAHGLADLLVAMARHPQAEAYRASLPVAGVDGTLAGRLRGARTAAHLVAKTGTLRHVTALAGYATPVAGEPLAFVILVNHATTPMEEVRAAVDQVAAAIATP